MSGDDSHVISDGVFPNGLYTTAIDDFSPDTEIAKLQKENGRIKVTNSILTALVKKPV